MDETQAKQKIDQLTELVLYHSRRYYDQDAPEIEDYEYDRLLHQLMDLEEAYPQFAHPDSPTRYFKRLERRYGIEDFHPHKLRHSFASVTIKNGGDIASVSEILGHSDKAVTLRMYTHADEESKKRAGSIFRNAIAANN